MHRLVIVLIWTIISVSALNISLDVDKLLESPLNYDKHILSWHTYPPEPITPYTPPDNRDFSHNYALSITTHHISSGAKPPTRTGMATWVLDMISIQSDHLDGDPAQTMAIGLYHSSSNQKGIILAIPSQSSPGTNTDVGLPFYIVNPSRDMIQVLSLQCALSMYLKTISSHLSMVSGSQHGSSHDQILLQVRQLAIDAFSLDYILEISSICGDDDSGDDYASHNNRYGGSPPSLVISHDIQRDAILSIIMDHHVLTTHTLYLSASPHALNFDLPSQTHRATTAPQPLLSTDKSSTASSVLQHVKLIPDISHGYHVGEPIELTWDIFPPPYNTPSDMLLYFYLISTPNTALLPSSSSSSSTASPNIPLPCPTTVLIAIRPVSSPHLEAIIPLIPYSLTTYIVVSLSPLQMACLPPSQHQQPHNASSHPFLHGVDLRVMTTITVLPACYHRDGTPKCGVHGVCDVVSSQCICHDGYHGDACQLSPCSHGHDGEFEHQHRHQHQHRDQLHNQDQDFKCHHLSQIYSLVDYDDDDHHGDIEPPQPSTTIPTVSLGGSLASSLSLAYPEISLLHQFPSTITLPQSPHSYSDARPHQQTTCQLYCGPNGTPNLQCTSCLCQYGYATLGTRSGDADHHHHGDTSPCNVQVIYTTLALDSGSLSWSRGHATFEQNRQSVLPFILQNSRLFPDVRERLRHEHYIRHEASLGSSYTAYDVNQSVIHEYQSKLFNYSYQDVWLVLLEYELNVLFNTIVDLYLANQPLYQQLVLGRSDSGEVPENTTVTPLHLVSVQLHDVVTADTPDQYLFQFSIAFPTTTFNSEQQRMQPWSFQQIQTVWDESLPFMMTTLGISTPHVNAPPAAARYHTQHGHHTSPTFIPPRPKPLQHTLSNGVSLPNGPLIAIIVCAGVVIAACAGAITYLAVKAVIDRRNRNNRTQAKARRSHKGSLGDRRHTVEFNNLNIRHLPGGGVNLAKIYGITDDDKDHVDDIESVLDENSVIIHATEPDSTVPPVQTAKPMTVNKVQNDNYTIDMIIADDIETTQASHPHGQSTHFSLDDMRATMSTFSLDRIPEEHSFSDEENIDEDKSGESQNEPQIDNDLEFNPTDDDIAELSHSHSSSQQHGRFDSDGDHPISASAHRQYSTTIAGHPFTSRSQPDYSESFEEDSILHDHTFVHPIDFTGLLRSPTASTVGGRSYHSPASLLANHTALCRNSSDIDDAPLHLQASTSGHSRTGPVIHQQRGEVRVLSSARSLGSVPDSDDEQQQDIESSSPSSQEPSYPELPPPPPPVIVIAEHQERPCKGTCRYGKKMKRLARRQRKKNQPPPSPRYHRYSHTSLIETNISPVSQQIDPLPPTMISLSPQNDSVRSQSPAATTTTSGGTTENGVDGESVTTPTNRAAHEDNGETPSQQSTPVNTEIDLSIRRSFLQRHSHLFYDYSKLEPLPSIDTQLSSPYARRYGSTLHRNRGTIRSPLAHRSASLHRHPHSAYHHYPTDQQPSPQHSQGSNSSEYNHHKQQSFTLLPSFPESPKSDQDLHDFIEDGQHKPDTDHPQSRSTPVPEFEDKQEHTNQLHLDKGRAKTTTSGHGTATPPRVLPDNDNHADNENENKRTPSIIFPPHHSSVDDLQSTPADHAVDDSDANHPVKPPALVGQTTLELAPTLVLPPTQQSLLIKLHDDNDDDDENDVYDPTKPLPNAIGETAIYQKPQTPPTPSSLRKGFETSSFFKLPSLTIDIEEQPADQLRTSFSLFTPRFQHQQQLSFPHEDTPSHSYQPSLGGSSFSSRHHLRTATPRTGSSAGAGSGSGSYMAGFFSLPPPLLRIHDDDDDGGDDDNVHPDDDDDTVNHCTCYDNDTPDHDGQRIVLSGAPQVRSYKPRKSIGKKPPRSRRTRRKSVRASSASVGGHISDDSSTILSHKTTTSTGAQSHEHNTTLSHPSPLNETTPNAPTGPTSRRGAKRPSVFGRVSRVSMRPRPSSSFIARHDSNYSASSVPSQGSIGPSSRNSSPYHPSIRSMVYPLGSSRSQSSFSHSSSSGGLSDGRRSIAVTQIAIVPNDAASGAIPNTTDEFKAMSLGRTRGRSIIVHSGSVSTLQFPNSALTVSESSNTLPGMAGAIRDVSLTRTVDGRITVTQPIIVSTSGLSSHYSSDRQSSDGNETHSSIPSSVPRIKLLRPSSRNTTIPSLPTQEELPTVSSLRAGATSRPPGQVVYQIYSDSYDSPLPTKFQRRIHTIDDGNTQDNHMPAIAADSTYPLSSVPLTVISDRSSSSYNTHSQPTSPRQLRQGGNSLGDDVATFPVKNLNQVLTEFDNGADHHDIDDDDDDDAFRHLPKLTETTRFSNQESASGLSPTYQQYTLHHEDPSIIFPYNSQSSRPRSSVHHTSSSLDPEGGQEPLNAPLQKSSTMTNIPHGKTLSLLDEHRTLDTDDALRAQPTIHHTDRFPHTDSSTSTSDASISASTAVESMTGRSLYHGYDDALSQRSHASGRSHLSGHRYQLDDEGYRISFQQSFSRGFGGLQLPHGNYQLHDSAESQSTTQSVQERPSQIHRTPSAKVKTRKHPRRTPSMHLQSTSKRGSFKMPRGSFRRSFYAIGVDSTTGGGTEDAQIPTPRPSLKIQYTLYDSISKTHMKLSIPATTVGNLMDLNNPNHPHNVPIPPAHLHDLQGNGDADDEESVGIVDYIPYGTQTQTQRQHQQQLVQSHMASTSDSVPAVGANNLTPNNTLPVLHTHTTLNGDDLSNQTMSASPNLDEIVIIPPTRRKVSFFKLFRFRNKKPQPSKAQQNQDNMARSSLFGGELVDGKGSASGSSSLKSIPEPSPLQSPSHLSHNGGIALPPSPSLVSRNAHQNETSRSPSLSNLRLATANSPVLRPAIKAPSLATIMSSNNDSNPMFQRFSHGLPVFDHGIGHSTQQSQGSPIMHSPSLIPGSASPGFPSPGLATHSLPSFSLYHQSQVTPVPLSPALPPSASPQQPRSTLSNLANLFSFTTDSNSHAKHPQISNALPLSTGGLIFHPYTQSFKYNDLIMRFMSIMANPQQAGYPSMNTTSMHLATPPFGFRPSEASTASAPDYQSGNAITGSLSFGFPSHNQHHTPGGLASGPSFQYRHTAQFAGGGLPYVPSSIGPGLTSMNSSLLKDSLQGTTLAMQMLENYFTSHPVIRSQLFPHEVYVHTYHSNPVVMKQREKQQQKDAKDKEKSQPSSTPSFLPFSSPGTASQQQSSGTSISDGTSSHPGDSRRPIVVSLPISYQPNPRVTNRFSYHAIHDEPLSSAIYDKPRHLSLLQRRNGHLLSTPMCQQHIGNQTPVPTVILAHAARQLDQQVQKLRSTHFFAEANHLLHQNVLHVIPVKLRYKSLRYRNYKYQCFEDDDDSEQARFLRNNILFAQAALVSSPHPLTIGSQHMNPRSSMGTASNANTRTSQTSYNSTAATTNTMVSSPTTSSANAEHISAPHQIVAVGGGDNEPEFLISSQLLQLEQQKMAMRQKRVEKKRKMKRQQKGQPRRGSDLVTYSRHNSTHHSIAGSGSTSAHRTSGGKQLSRHHPHHHTRYEHQAVLLDTKDIHPHPPHQDIDGPTTRRGSMQTIRRGSYASMGSVQSGYADSTGAPGPTATVVVSSSGVIASHPAAATITTSSTSGLSHRRDDEGGDVPLSQSQPTDSRRSSAFSRTNRSTINSNSSSTSHSTTLGTTIPLTTAVTPKSQRFEVYHSSDVDEDAKSDLHRYSGRDHSHFSHRSAHREDTDYTDDHHDHDDDDDDSILYNQTPLPGRLVDRGFQYSDDDINRYPSSSLSDSDDTTYPRGKNIPVHYQINDSTYMDSMGCYDDDDDDDDDGYYVPDYRIKALGVSSSAMRHADQQFSNEIAGGDDLGVGANSTTIPLSMTNPPHSVSQHTPAATTSHNAEDETQLNWARHRDQAFYARRSSLGHYGGKMVSDDES